jgi:hypothetical protein
VGRGMTVEQYDDIEHRALGCDCCDGGRCSDPECVALLMKLAMSRGFFQKRARWALTQVGVAVAA